MQLIWKYEIPPDGGVFALSVPMHSRPVHAGLDPEGTPCMWMMVGTQFAKYEVRFHAVYTGEPMPSGRYLFTFNHGPLVWHIFEVL